MTQPPMADGVPGRQHLTSKLNPKRVEIALLHLRVVAHKAFLVGATREQADAIIAEALARLPEEDACAENGIGDHDCTEHRKDA